MKPLPSLSNTLKASLLSSSESVSFILGHQVEELGKVDGSGGVSIDFVDHVLELSLGGVLPEGAHHSPQLLGGDGAVAILVEKGEGLFEFGDLFLCKLIGHC